MRYNYKQSMARAAKAFLDAKGRAPRADFWSFALTAWLGIPAFVLFCIPVERSLVFNHTLTPAEFRDGFGYVMLALLLFSSGTYMALQVMRLHDQGRDGSLVLLNFLPIIGWLILLTLMLKPGTVGPNGYGPDPRGAGNVVSSDI